MSPLKARTISLTEAEARTYTLDVLQHEFREAAEDYLTDVPAEEGGPTEWQEKWAKEAAKRIAENWAMRRDGFVDFALEDAA